MKLAPIILFTYSRPQHTKIVLDALAKNREAKNSLLYIFCDGLKLNANEKIKEAVKDISNIISAENRFKEVIIEKSATNKGLAQSIIDGVSKVVNEHGTAIILEDDIKVENGFLKYMNEALQLYENEEKVGCIHAWNYSFGTIPTKESTFFLKGADCWGWATWKRAWDLFNPDGKFLLNQIKSNNLEYDFNRQNTHEFVKMLEDQIQGKNNSWAIRWHASLFLAYKFCLQPTFPIVENIGLDGSGEHCGEANLNQKTVSAISLQKISPIKEAEWFFEVFRETQKDTKAKNKTSTIQNIKQFIPIGILNRYKNLRYGKSNTPAVEKKEIWSGDFSSWEEASKQCKGYNAVNILEKCKDALMKVKNGEAKYERDSVLFDEIQYSFGLLAGLQKAALENGNKLCVLDFGGSLGSSYYQNKDFLSVENLEWCIVEQENFVKCGKENFENDQLKFYLTVDECLANHQPNVILLSSVLPYLENPYKTLEAFLKLNIDFIILDRNPFIETDEDLLTIQNVPEEIYEASYPAWFFSEKKMLSKILKNYDLVAPFKNNFTSDYIINKSVTAEWKGFIFKHKMI